MGRWAALFGTMRNARMRRIGRREAEQLLSGAPVNPDRAGLAQLLDLVASAPRAEELADREHAVAAFARVRHAAMSEPLPYRRRSAVSVVSRAAYTKLLVGLFVLLLGGTALAASTGILPDGMQHGAHELFAPFGLPVPDSATPTPQGTPSPSPTPSAGTSASPDDPVAVAACQTWQALPKDGRNLPNTPSMRALAEAAGGVDKIPAYCAAVLDPANPAATPQPTPADPGKPRPTHPDPSGGHGKPSKTPHR